MSSKKLSTPRIPTNSKPSPKKLTPPPAPQGPPPQPVSYTIEFSAVNNLVECLNELVTGKHAKKAVFDIINSSFVPNFPDLKEIKK
jgi:hypothetical protein